MEGTNLGFPILVIINDNSEAGGFGGEINVRISKHERSQRAYECATADLVLK